MENSPFKPLSSKRVFEQISDQIRDLIYSGVFRTGEKLPSERELAIQFHVGRTALREALRVLENEDLILIRQGSNGGSFISRPKIHKATKSAADLFHLGELDLQDITEARIPLELAVLEFAIDRMTQEDFDHLERMNISTDEYLKRGDTPVSDITNFHVYLAKSTKNPVFEMLVGSMVNLVFKILGKIENRDGQRTTLDRHLFQHRQVLERLKEGDLEKAKEAMKEHLLSTHNNIERALQKSAKGFMDDKVKNT
jgi:GntR family transcriptional repressor for pyruvate dehydrogenase complex